MFDRGFVGGREGSEEGSGGRGDAGIGIEVEVDMLCLSAYPLQEVWMCDLLCC